MAPDPVAAPTPLSDRELAAFGRRRIALTAAMVASWVLLAATYLFPEWAHASDWPYRAFVALTGVWLVGFLVAWRCPRCRAMLFGQLRPRFCGRCGVAFERAAPRA